MPSGCAVDRAEAHAFGRRGRPSRSCRSFAPRRPPLRARRCRSAVISRASNSTRPAPISAIVCRSLENEGSVESNCALSKPSETKTSVTKSPEPPTTGSLWQPAQELKSGPLVRVNAGLTPLLRLVGTIACVAFGRPAPSSVVNLALNRSRPRSISAGSADGPAAAMASKSRCDAEDLLIPTAANAAPRRRPRRPAPNSAARRPVGSRTFSSCPCDLADRRSPRIGRANLVTTERLPQGR